MDSQSGDVVKKDVELKLDSYCIKYEIFPQILYVLINLSRMRIPINPNFYLIVCTVQISSLLKSGVYQNFLYYIVILFAKKVSIISISYYYIILYKFFSKKYLITTKIALTRNRDNDFFSIFKQMKTTS